MRRTAAGLALVAWTCCEAASLTVPSGVEYFRTSADMYILRCSRADRFEYSALPGIRSIIEYVVGQIGRSDRDYRNLARDLEGADCPGREDLDEYFFKLAVRLSRIPNLDILEIPGLFEDPKRQTLYARILRLAKRVGADRHLLIACYSSSGTETWTARVEESLLESRLNEVEESQDLYIVQRLFQCSGLVPQSRSESADRLFSLFQTDIPDTLEFHGISEFGIFDNTLGERNIKLTRQLFNLKKILSTDDANDDAAGLKEMVLDSFFDTALAIVSVPSEDLVGIGSTCSAFFDLLDDFFDLLTGEENESESKNFRFKLFMDQAVSLTRSIHATFPELSTRLSLAKQELVNVIEDVMVVHRDARVFLRATLLEVVDRFFANVTRFLKYLPDDRPSRLVEVIDLIVYVALQVIEGDPKRFSRISLKEWLDALPKRQEDLLRSLFTVPDAALLKFTYRVGRAFGIRILDPSQQIFPEWSPERIEAVEGLIKAKIFFGKDHVSHSIKLANAEEPRLIRASFLVAQMIENGINGLRELSFLIDPIDWAMEYISDPQSVFANWISDHYISGNGPLKKYQRFCQQVNLIYFNANWHGNMSPELTNWLFDYPKRIMRLEIEAAYPGVFEEHAIALFRLVEMCFDPFQKTTQENSRLLLAHFADVFDTLVLDLEDSQKGFAEKINLESFIDSLADMKADIAALVEQENNSSQISLE